MNINRHKIKYLVFSLSFMLITINPNAKALDSQKEKQIPIWQKDSLKPRSAKDSEILIKGDSLIAGKTVTIIKKVSNPTITIYPAKGKNTGVSVLVFPGGGYKILAVDLEGTEVCGWLTAKGINCMLLKYRVPFSGSYWDNKSKTHIKPKVPMALQDAQRSLSLLRFHAKELNINPKKIGVLGFSAGGHLVADVSTHFKKRVYKTIDSADKVSCRPDFAISIYPGHMLENTKKEFELNPTVPVTKDVPPTFILQAQDDPVDQVENSLVYYIALKKHGVPTEMHLYANGGHAFGLRRTKSPITAWPNLVETWLKTIKITEN